VGVYGIPDEMKPASFMSLTSLWKPALVLGNAPASTIVVGIYANDQKACSIEEEPLLGRPLGLTNASGLSVVVHCAGSIRRTGREDLIYM